MKTAWVVTALAAAGIVVYAASPFVGLYRLGTALHSADLDTVIERVDIASVRRSIVEQIVDEAGREPQVAKALDKLGNAGKALAIRTAAAEFDRRLAEIMTPDLLRRLIVDGELAPDLAGRLAPDESMRAPGDEAFLGIPENPLRFVQDWGFRSTRKFGAVIGDPTRPDDWTGLALRLNGLTWQLSEVELPRSVVARVQPIIRKAIDDLRS